MGSLGWVAVYAYLWLVAALGVLMVGGIVIVVGVAFAGHRRARRDEQSSAGGT